MEIENIGSDRFTLYDIDFQWKESESNRYRIGIESLPILSMYSLYLAILGRKTHHVFKYKVHIYD